MEIELQRKELQRAQVQQLIVQALQFSEKLEKLCNRYNSNRMRNINATDLTPYQFLDMLGDDDFAINLDPVVMDIIKTDNNNITRGLTLYNNLQRIPIKPAKSHTVVL